MWGPNIGPELPDPSAAHASDHARRGNPSLVYRDELPTDDVAAASTRASVVTHRFGGVRYALSRPKPAQPELSSPDEPMFDFRLAWPWQPTLELPIDRPDPDGGESDAHD
jgi:hypothetical protein